MTRMTKKQNLSPTISIGDKLVGENYPVFIIAELSANHLQKYDLAVKTIHAMKKAGADAVKLQTYTPDTITIDCNNKYFQIRKTIWKRQTLYSLYQTAYTPWEWQPRLKKIAEGLGLICFSSAFDTSAVDFLEKMNVPAYKIASPEILDIPLIEYIAKKGKPMIISTGIASLAEIDEAVNTCKKAGNNQIIILKCSSVYPTPYKEVNLRTIPNLKETFSVPVGISDHTLGVSIPIAAVALGARIVEKHFILDRNIGGTDSKFSLEPQEFKTMVDSIRQVEQSLGQITYNVTSKNMQEERNEARSLFVVKNIKKGEIFTLENLRSIRPGYGISPKYFKEILGKKSKTDIPRGTPLDWSLLI